MLSNPEAPTDKLQFIQYSGSELSDQFGGEHMKKFRYRNLKETILKIQKESMSQQRAILDDTIEKWRGDLDQLDDILMIGRRF